MKFHKQALESNSGNKFIKAFQLFKILINSIDKLISPMTLTEEVLRTQFYDKVDEYNTLEYTKQSYRLENCETKIKDFYKISSCIGRGK